MFSETMDSEQTVVYESYSMHRFSDDLTKEVLTIAILDIQ